MNKGCGECLRDRQCNDCPSFVGDMRIDKRNGRVYHYCKNCKNVNLCNTVFTMTCNNCRTRRLDPNRCKCNFTPVCMCCKCPHCSGKGWIPCKCTYYDENGLGHIDTSDMSRMAGLQEHITGLFGESSINGSLCGHCLGESPYCSHCNGTGTIEMEGLLKPVKKFRCKCGGRKIVRCQNCL